MRFAISYLLRLKMAQRPYSQVLAFFGGETSNFHHMQAGARFGSGGQLG